MACTMMMALTFMKMFFMPSMEQPDISLDDDGTKQVPDILLKRRTVIVPMKMTMKMDRRSDRKIKFPLDWMRKFVMILSRLLITPAHFQTLS